MRLIIIGAVAAGTSAAAKTRRNTEDAEIVIYEKDSFISYSGCGIMEKFVTNTNMDVITNNKFT
jgi:NADPH-dependent 2,4-dienoyl-CoA reductase/sulfur reductase-like enzyme